MPTFPLLVTLVSSPIIGTVVVTGSDTPSDSHSNPSSAILSETFGMMYDGVSGNWNRQRGSIANGLLVDVSRVQANVSTTSRASSSGQIVLLASAARNSNGSALITGLDNYRTGLIQLDVTSVSGGTPVMDVYLDAQTDGSTWINIVHFTQIGGAAARRAVLLSDYAAPSTSDFDATASLAAGTVRLGHWCNTLRVQWILGGSTPSYTFDITGSFRS